MPWRKGGVGARGNDRRSVAICATCPEQRTEASSRVAISTGRFSGRLFIWMDAVTAENFATNGIAMANSAAEPLPRHCAGSTPGCRWCPIRSAMKSRLVRRRSKSSQYCPGSGYERGVAMRRGANVRRSTSWNRSDVMLARVMSRWLTGAKFDFRQETADLVRRDSQDAL